MIEKHINILEDHVIAALGPSAARYDISGLVTDLVDHIDSHQGWADDEDYTPELLHALGPFDQIKENYRIIA